MKFQILDLDLIDYERALALQREAFKGIKLGLFESTLLLCRHHPVITLGRQAVINNILVPRELLEERDISIVPVERGGDITYHGPGQLIAYPIFNLADYSRDIHFFLRQLEECVILTLADFGIKAGRVQGKTGVWVEERKIASLGICVRNWITTHGISMNIEAEDTHNFRFIRPCGMDIKVVSLEELLDRKIEMTQVKEALANKFKELFSMNRELVSREV